MLQFQDTMIVFGGLLVPSETFTDLLWTYNFTSGLWEVMPTAQGNDSLSLNFTTTQNVSMEFNDTEFDYANDTNDTVPWELPLPVRGHTAHIIGNKMIIFFGLAYAADLFPSALQQLDLGEHSGTNKLKFGAVVLVDILCFSA